MRHFAVLLVLGVAACGRPAETKTAREPSKAPTATSVAAAQSMIAGRATAEMRLIPIPSDKAQLNRMLAAGYTIHKDHMHPPGVKSCPLDKNSGGVVE